MSLEPVFPPRPLHWPPIVSAIQAIVPPDQDVYLVGGAVRDAVLQRELHDIDLATSSDGRPLAKRIANHFDGAYYSLDAERGVGRALINWEGQQLTVDVAQFRGPDLHTDLQKRDFTLNAMAVSMSGDLQAIIDPLGSLADLAARQLRQCNPDSVASDPVRALRAIRTSITHTLRITPTTQQAIRTSGPRLAYIAPERVRDEFFTILSGPHPAKALRTMQHVDLLACVLPETSAMLGLSQSQPHQFDVWRHTLAVVEHLDSLQLVVAPRGDDNLTASVQGAAIAVALSGIRKEIQVHIDHQWPNARPHRGLMLLAALLHDAGKPQTRTVDGEGHIHFRRHEQIGADLAETRGSALRLSNDEVDRLTTIIRHHMRPLWLHTGGQLTPRAIYRFWRDTGPAGVDVCLLSIADYLGTYGTHLKQDDWLAFLEHQQTLLERYFLHHTTAVAPPPLLSGRDLIQAFGLQPGPMIGTLLERISEAQVDGEITTRKEALELAQRFLESSS